MTPPQGLFGGTAGREFFLNFGDRSAVGATLSEVAAFIIPDGMSGSNPRIISEYCDFQRKCFKKPERLTGFSPLPFRPPQKSDNSQNR
jgi:hypothetical protein